MVGAGFNTILNLTITANQVDFTFDSESDYRNGLTKLNAVRLDVDATVPWDLFAYATTDHWTEVNGSSGAQLPAELLEIRSSNPNQSTPAGGSFNTFTGIKGITNSGVMAGVPDANSTQFIAGMVGKDQGQYYYPGTAQNNPQTNSFNLDYRIVPGLPASFPNGTLSVGSGSSSSSGDFYLEVVYVLVEDL